MNLFFLLVLLTGTLDRESLRFAYVAEQGYDSSCGLSTLSTLLEEFWGLPADETELAREHFKAKLATGDLRVSFADLAMVLASKGLVWAGYRMTYGQLVEAIGAYAPLVVHLDRPEGHFALGLAADDERILIADPAEGLLFWERATFEGRWSGKVLLAALPGRGVDRDRLAEIVETAKARLGLLNLVAARLAKDADH